MPIRRSSARRTARRRSDLASLREAQSCLHYVVGGEWVVLKKTANGFDPAFSFSEVGALAKETQTLFLGLQGDAARFGVGLDPAFAEKPENARGIFRHRSAFDRRAGLVAFDHLPALAEAKSMLLGMRVIAFCANCGAPTNDLARRLAARLRAMQGAAFSAHRSGGDHARHRRRQLPARPLGAVRRQQLFLPRRLRRSRAKASRKPCGARRWRKRESRCGRVRYFASQPWPFPSS
jgi:NAD+ diphosphatase